jgi:hypothetical protein
MVRSETSIVTTLPAAPVADPMSIDAAPALAAVRRQSSPAATKGRTHRLLVAISQLFAPDCPA